MGLKRIGSYKIIRKLGEGGMATVYEAVHIRLGTKVAIKILKAEYQVNAIIRKRFINEAKITARLIHPNIVRVLDFIESHEGTVIVMEYLDGLNLAQYLKKYQPSIDRKISLFIQVLKALDFAHRHGIIHRDIKPENIFLLHDHTVKVLDFGIAKISENDLKLTSTGTQMGTPLYMSPEQVKEVSQVDNLTDIYSLGVVLYFLLEGKPPYNVETLSKYEIFNKIVNEPLKRLTKHKEYQLVIDKATRKIPTERYLTCRDFARDLIEIKKGKKKVIGDEALKALYFAKVDREKSNKTYRVQIRETVSAGIERKRKKWISSFIGMGLFLIAGGIGFYFYRLNKDWQIVLPAPYTQTARAIVSNNDNTFTVLVNKWQNKWPEVYLLKIDANGKLLGEQKVNVGNAEAKNMIADDRFLLLSGYKRVGDKGRTWGAKIDRSGRVLWESTRIWEKKFGDKFWDGYAWDTSKWSTGYDVAINRLNPDARYVFAGTGQFDDDTGRYKNGILTYTIGKDGSVQNWNGTFPLVDHVAYAVTPSNEYNGSLITGYKSSLRNKRDAFVIRLDKNGFRKWEQSYGGPGNDKGFRILAVGDGYIIAGYTSSYNNKKNGNAYLFKIDEKGDLQWQYTMGHEGQDEFLAIKKDSYNGGYILCGYTQDVYNNQDMWFVKVDENGKILWEKKIGDSQKKELARDIIPLGDNHYIGVGYQFNPGTDKDVFIVKFKIKNEKQ